MKCRHNLLKMGYVQAQEYAFDRMRENVKQLLCPVCNKYLWPEEWFPTDKKTQLVKICVMFKNGRVCAVNHGDVKYYKYLSRVPTPCTLVFDKKYLDRDRRLKR